MEILQSVFDFILGNWDQLFEIIGVAAVVASLTPNKSDDKIVGFVLDILNTLGANVFRAKNADDA